MAPKRVTLREVRDELGVRVLEAILAPDGTLTIEGQDLGDGVEQFFGPGNREYEWIWTIRAAEAVKLAAALGSPGNVLSGLQARFSGKAAAELQPFLEQHGIVYEGWSRVGD